MPNHAASPSPLQNVEITERVNMLYGDACRKFPTYETMVLKHFCSRMIKTFGDDETSPEVAETFAYARCAYDYLSPPEIEAHMDDNRSHGICSHGLTENTCPCGCFELPGPDDHVDFSTDGYYPEDDSELIRKEWAEKEERWRQEEIADASRTGMKAIVLNTKNACIRSVLKILRLWR
ncbi:MULTISPECIES: regulator [Pseudomonas syringae group]|uniref:Regulator n=2 Tax=Pseudomonas syringae group TaxID=136849 RepID=A0A2K4X0Q0_PSESX|nr:MULTISPECIES: regulator [Pseudomonas syringae group]AVB13232.1 regulator [Pseudomonas amygdali pv. morsprunorum]MDT3227509.1 regulator [Pseudomonas amygdali pv. morsprunorum]MDT3244591.1 regulator [Pseudomonas amygdali pv. morsprunorum]MDT3268254.1 regulator [Pseudomonas amygdali pv. morsprunorum]POC82172.1 regulator [Pseudomonas amygdali pv. morsprunorum]